MFAGKCWTLALCWQDGVCFVAERSGRPSRSPGIMSLGDIPQAGKLHRWVYLQFVVQMHPGRAPDRPAAVQDSGREARLQKPREMTFAAT